MPNDELNSATQPKSTTQPNPATEQVSEAHGSLKTLREKIGAHPELEDAINRLEMALSILTVNTGGML